MKDVYHFYLTNGGEIELVNNNSKKFIGGCYGSEVVGNIYENPELLKESKE